MGSNARELEKQWRKAPGDLALRLELADSYQQLGRTDDALAHYRAVALAYRADGRLPQAVAAARRALAVAPDDVELARMVTGGAAPGPMRSPDEESYTPTETPLPLPVPFHEADPSRIGATVAEVDGDDGDKRTDVYDDDDRTDVFGDLELDLATDTGPSAAVPRPLEGDDLSAELETRRRPRLDRRDLDRLGVPPTVPSPEPEPEPDPDDDVATDPGRRDG